MGGSWAMGALGLLVVDSFLGGLDFFFLGFAGFRSQASAPS